MVFLNLVILTVSRENATKLLKPLNEKTNNKIYSVIIVIVTLLFDLRLSIKLLSFIKKN